jgi:hypothetical protein
VPPGLAALNTGQNAAITSISCPSAGNCAAGGYYQTDVMDADDGNPDEAFVVSHASSRWGTAEELPGSDALNGGWDASVLSVSCPSAGNCAAGGYLQPNQDMDCDPPGASPPALNCEGSFVANARNGRWGDARYPAYPGMSQVSSVSCSSAADCSAGGYSINLSNDVILPEVMTERSARWGTPAPIPGIPALFRSVKGNQSKVISLSCWSPGNCGAGGYYSDDFNGHGQVFVASERDGRWGAAKEAPGTAALNLGKIDQITAVSCTRPRTCTAVGFYTDHSGHTQAFAGGEAE